MSPLLSKLSSADDGADQRALSGSPSRFNTTTSGSSQPRLPSFDLSEVQEHPWVDRCGAKNAAGKRPCDTGAHDVLAR